MKIYVIVDEGTDYVLNEDSLFFKNAESCARGLFESNYTDPSFEEMRSVISVLIQVPIGEKAMLTEFPGQAVLVLEAK